MSNSENFSLPCPNSGLYDNGPSHTACPPENILVGCCIPPCPNAKNGCLNNDTTSSYNSNHTGEFPSSYCSENGFTGSWFICPDFFQHHPCSNDCRTHSPLLDPLLKNSSVVSSIWNAISHAHTDMPLLSISTSSTVSPEPTDTGFGPGDDGPGLSNTQSVITSTSDPSNTPTTATLGQSEPPTATPGSKSNTAAIAGGIVGGIVGLALLVALLAICYRRRATKPQQYMDGAGSSARNLGNVHFLQPGETELEEAKQGPSPTSSPPRPPPSSPSHLTSSAPPPPAYTPYRPRGNDLDRTPNLPQPNASSVHPSHDLPSSESPPLPSPLKSHLSRHSDDHDSDEQNVSPISSHYQHHPFDETGGHESSTFSDVSSNELLRNHGVRL